MCPHGFDEAVLAGARREREHGVKPVDLEDWTASTGAVMTPCGGMPSGITGASGRFQMTQVVKEHPGS